MLSMKVEKGFIWDLEMYIPKALPINSAVTTVVQVCMLQIVMSTVLMGVTVA